MISFKETAAHIKADLKRRLALEDKTPSVIAVLSIVFKPGIISVLCYRISRFCYCHRLKVVCKVIALFDQLLNTSEISPLAQIGPGLVLSDCGAVGIPNTAIIGKNCTFLGLNTFTLGAMEKPPGPEDQIIVGDHCVFGIFSRVIRPVKLASGTQIKPSSVVIASSKKEGQTYSGIPAKRKEQVDYQEIQQWNPLKGRPLLKQSV